MRLPPIAPAKLTSEQRPLYENMKKGVSAKYDAFITMREDGALLGPWSAWLQDPELGVAFWDVTDAMTRAKRIADSARQVAILVVGVRFHAAYEIYAHEAVARTVHKMSSGRLATLCSGGRPVDLDPQESAAFDVASALVNGGVLPEPTYRNALDVFGQKGLNELIYLVGHYCFVSITLNGFDIPVPVGSE
jgi:4-carboxymuconolactone decarboxylase